MGQGSLSKEACPSSENEAVLGIGQVLQVCDELGIETAPAEARMSAIAICLN